MGFFDFLKKSAEPAAPAAPAFPVTLAADAKGTVVAMENIPDGVFAQGILGKCCGIDPTEGKIYAPADGEITQAPDSGHALGIMTTAGVEVLIHVGVDTVEMKGDGFSPKVKEGDKVKKGDLLLEIRPGWEIVYEDLNGTREYIRHSAIPAPAFFFGRNVKPVRITREIDATAIAPTVSSILRIRSPNAANSATLPELQQ